MGATATTSQSLKAAKIQANDHPKTKHKKRFKHVTWQPLIFRCLLRFKSCLELIEWLSYMSIYCISYILITHQYWFKPRLFRPFWGHQSPFLGWPSGNLILMVWAMFISISRFFGRSVVIPLVNFAHTQLGVPLLRTSFLEKKLSPQSCWDAPDKCRCSMARKAMDFCVNIKRHTPRILVLILLNETQLRSSHHDTIDFLPSISNKRRWNLNSQEFLMNPVRSSTLSNLETDWPRISRIPTVDGSEIRRLHQLSLVVYPIVYKVLYIPGGCLGFLNRQQ